MLACSYSLNLEDIMMVNILGMVLKYCKYGVCGDLLEKSKERGREREGRRLERVGEGFEC